MITIAMCFRVFRLTRLCTALQPISSLNSWQTALVQSIRDRYLHFAITAPASVSSFPFCSMSISLNHPGSRLLSTAMTMDYNQTWDLGCMIAYWAKQPDKDALSTAELALKSWSLFALACWPRCSDGARLVRSSIKFTENGEMHFRYKGTKNLKVPILGPQLGIPASQADPKVCVARCMKAYLDRTADLDRQHRV